MIKIWHDDLRNAPDDSWTVARTNLVAKSLLESDEVSEISIDHDLGFDNLADNVIDVEGFRSEGTGLDLARWMVAEGKVPDKVTIHSFSPSGARRIANTFKDAGYYCIVAPADMRFS